jgi:intracellular sulfur oxidation DsrE/DsrF family protein
MGRSLRSAMVAVMMAAGLMSFPAAVDAAGDVQKLALQISDNDKQKMNAVLNVAANVSRHYSAQGDEVQIEIVAFNAGLHMLRSDTSPVRDCVASFTKSMPNVTFQACDNTLQGMTKKEGKKPPLLSVAHIVPAGVVRLMELNRKGWTIIRP